MSEQQLHLESDSQLAFKYCAVALMVYQVVTDIFNKQDC